MDASLPMKDGMVCLSSILSILQSTEIPLPLLWQHRHRCTWLARTSKPPHQQRWGKGLDAKGVPQIPLANRLFSPTTGDTHSNLSTPVLHLRQCRGYPTQNLTSRRLSIAGELVRLQCA
jgi:hypothetical protein